MYLIEVYFSILFDIHFFSISSRNNQTTERNDNEIVSSFLARNSSIYVY